MVTYGDFIAFLEKAKEEEEERESTGYANSVALITNKMKTNSGKTNAIKALKAGKPSEYYKAIDAVVSTGMYDFEKLENMRAINENFED